MGKYHGSWSKTYRRSGTEIIEADSLLEAEIKLGSMLGDLEGNIQYDPTHDMIEVYEEREE